MFRINKHAYKTIFMNLSHNSYLIYFNLLDKQSDTSCFEHVSRPTDTQIKILKSQTHAHIDDTTRLEKSTGLCCSYMQLSTFSK